MSKKKKDKLNYFAGRVGFRGVNIAAVATHWTKEQLIAAYPNWVWSASNKAYFDSVTDKITIDNG